MYNEEVDFLEKVLMRALGQDIDIQTLQFISGGLVNQAVYTATSQGQFFIKFNEDRPLAMFEVEARALKLIKEKVPELKVPEVILWGEVAKRNVLVLEYLQDSHPTNKYWENLGKGVATLHQVSNNQFGLDYDNFNGVLRQQNSLSSNWGSFFFEKRLKSQFGLAFYNQLIPQHYLKKLESLRIAFEQLYTKTTPALLHGDFWRGNTLAIRGEQACIYDPAIYYGDREIDLATAQLLGGFDNTFFEIYQEVYPLRNGAKERMEIYSLYPLMIQVNLYGTSYLNKIDTILKKYC